MSEAADWFAAAGQIIAAAGTIVAVALAYQTAKTAERISRDAVEATRRQTTIAAIHDLARDYSAAGMYEALRTYGRFVADDPGRKEKFQRITEVYRRNGRRVDLAMAEGPDFAWAIEHTETNLELGAARRQIHHHFKRVWTLLRANVLIDPDDLRLLTSDAAGWTLWRDEVVPVTLAIAARQRDRGRQPGGNDWALELIDAVEKAKQPAA